ncbi:helix-turn-helix domain-containing protein [Desulfocastanea catecholica]
MNQRTQVFKHLKKNVSLSTLEARRQGWCHVAMRVCELRKMGFNIETRKTLDRTEDGSLHEVALYILQPKRQLFLPGMGGE